MAIKKTIAEHEIKFLLTAKNKTGKSFSKLKKVLPSIKTMAVAASKAILAIGIAASIATGTAVAQFKDFETALVDVARVTDQSLDDVKKNIMGLPPELGSATELVKGYYNTISAGVTDPINATALLTTAAKASRAAHLDLETTVSGITDVMDGFGGSLSGAAEASDKLFTIERIGKTRFSELAPVIGQVSSSANLLGVSIDELGGLFATVSKTAGGTERAATQVKSIFAALLKPTGDMSTVLDGMGFSSGQAAIESRGLVGTLAGLKEEIDRGNTSMTKLFSRQEALVGIGPSLKDSFRILDKNIIEMGNSAGTTDKAFEDWKKTLAGLWDTFINTVGRIAIEMVAEIAPDIQQALTDINFWLQDNKEEIALWVKDFIGGWREVAVFVKEETENIISSLKKMDTTMRPTIDAIVDVIGSFADGLTGFNLEEGVDRNAPAAERFGQLIRTIWHAWRDGFIELENMLQDFKEDFWGWTGNLLTRTGSFIDDLIIKFEELIGIDLARKLFPASDVKKEAAKVTAEIDDLASAAMSMRETIAGTPIDIEVNTGPAENSVETIKASLESIPLETSVEALVENINALASIETVKNDLDSVPNITRDIQMEINKALDAIDIVEHRLAAIPDVTVKTLVIKTMTEASPRRPFTEGMRYIEDKIRGLPSRQSLVIDTELPPAGLGIQPRHLLSASSPAGPTFPQGFDARQPVVNETTNQDIDITVNITTAEIDSNNIDSITNEIAESLARKLNTGRVNTFRQAIREV